MDTSKTARPYFGYGTLLGLGYMRSRYPSARLVGRGVYRDHELGFWSYGDDVDGGGCTIVDSPGRDLLGNLYSLDAKDAALLLAVDGHAARYEARDIDVLLGTGETVPAFTLRVHPDNGRWQPPEAYVQLVIDGAREADLPADYQARLLEIISEAQLPVADRPEASA